MTSPESSQSGGEYEALLETLLRETEPHESTVPTSTSEEVPIVRESMLERIRSLLCSSRFSSTIHSTYDALASRLQHPRVRMTALVAALLSPVAYDCHRVAQLCLARYDLHTSEKESEVFERKRVDAILRRRERDSKDAANKKLEEKIRLIEEETLQEAVSEFLSQWDTAWNSFDKSNLEILAIYKRMDFFDTIERVIIRGGSNMEYRLKKSIEDAFPEYTYEQVLWNRNINPSIHLLQVRQRILEKILERVLPDIAPHLQQGTLKVREAMDALLREIEPGMNDAQRTAFIKQSYPLPLDKRPGESWTIYDLKLATERHHYISPAKARTTAAILVGIAEAHRNAQEPSRSISKAEQWLKVESELNRGFFYFTDKKEFAALRLLLERFLAGIPLYSKEILQSVKSTHRYREDHEGEVRSAKQWTGADGNLVKNAERREAELAYTMQPEVDFRFPEIVDRLVAKDGHLAVSAGATLHIYKDDDKILEIPAQGKVGGIFTLCTIRDSMHLVRESDDGMLMMTDIQTGNIERIAIPTPNVRSVFPHGGWLYLTMNGDPTIHKVSIEDARKESVKMPIDIGNQLHVIDVQEKDGHVTCVVIAEHKRRQNNLARITINPDSTTKAEHPDLNGHVLAYDPTRQVAWVQTETLPDLANTVIIRKINPWTLKLEPGRYSMSTPNPDIHASLDDDHTTHIGGEGEKKFLYLFFPEECRFNRFPNPDGNRASHTVSVGTGVEPKDYSTTSNSERSGLFAVSRHKLFTGGNGGRGRIITRYSMERYADEQEY